MAAVWKTFAVSLDSIEVCQCVFVHAKTHNYY